MADCRLAFYGKRSASAHHMMMAPLSTPLWTKWPAASSRAAQSSSSVWVPRWACGRGKSGPCMAVWPMPALEMKVFWNLHAS
eukprot:11217855-Alexandrium_andersonii.AAC.1